MPHSGCSGFKLPTERLMVCGGGSQLGGMHAAIPGPEGGRNLGQLQLAPTPVF